MSADKDSPQTCAFRAVTAYIAAAARIGWDLSQGHLFPVVSDEGHRGASPLSAPRMTAALKSHLRAAGLSDRYTMHSFWVGGSLICLGASNKNSCSPCPRVHTCAHAFTVRPMLSFTTTECSDQDKKRFAFFEQVFLQRPATRAFFRLVNHLFFFTFYGGYAPTLCIHSKLDPVADEGTKDDRNYPASKTKKATVARGRRKIY